MLDITADPKPAARHTDQVDIESEFTELEGVAVALKIVRHGSGIFSDLRHDSSAYQHALFTMVDTVLDQIEKLSKVYRGEGHDGDEDEEDDTTEERQCKALCAMRDLTLEDVKALSPHGRLVLDSFCRRVGSLIEKADDEPEAASCP